MDVPEIPNKEGHLAVWSVTDFTNITSNLSVNAIYTADLMTVTFKMNGQSDIVAIRVVPYGGTLTDIPVAPYKEGYTGIWDKDFSNITSHITVTGRYQINQYTVSFDTNGGDPFDSITQDYGTLITAKPNKNGSTFMGWYDVSTTFKYTNVPGHDITLYAMWFDDNNIIIVT